jgi:hypothetical protein
MASFETLDRRPMSDRRHALTPTVVAMIDALARGDAS